MNIFFLFSRLYSMYALFHNSKVRVSKSRYLPFITDYLEHNKIFREAALLVHHQRRMAERRLKKITFKDFVNQIDKRLEQELIYDTRRGY